MRQENESVALACGIRFCNQEGCQQLWSVGDEMLKFAIYGIDGEDGVLSNVGVPMFKACATGRDEGLEEFGVFSDFLEETKGSATDVFVRMVEVVSNGVAVND